MVDHLGHNLGQDQEIAKMNVISRHSISVETGCSFPGGHCLVVGSEETAKSNGTLPVLPYAQARMKVRIGRWTGITTLNMITT